MNWSSASEFFAMGGSALYVWGAYGITALTIAIEFAGLVRRGRALRAGAAGSPRSNAD